MMKKIYKFLTVLGVFGLCLTGCAINNGGEQTQKWETPTYSWATDYSTCTAKRVCLTDPSKTEMETVSTTYEIISPAKCEVDGTGRYTASFTSNSFNVQMHDEPIESIGHDYQFDSFVWEGYTAQAKYVCSRDNSHIQYHNAQVTSEITIQPLCESEGLRTYTASYDGHTDTKTQILLEYGHQWNKPKYTWSDDYSICTAKKVCDLNPNHIFTETVYSTYEILEPTYELSNKIGRYTATFVNLSFSSQTHDIILEKYHGETPLISNDAKHIKYGLYPQTNVNDASLVSILNDLTAPETNGWYLYNNDYYAKVSATPYSSVYCFDDRTEIVSGTTYWFKCEPIIWNVLSYSNGNYFLLSSVLLDAHTYNDESWSGKDSNNRYANNYEFSGIRAWLNDDFYNSAFSLNDEYILTTTVDNSGSTLYGSSSFASNNTQDKVFMPSYKDYINSSYGFSTSKDSNTETRRCRITDWSKAKGGLVADFATGIAPFYCGIYWTRSPRGYADASKTVMSVLAGGQIWNWPISRNDSVRPAITVQLS